MRRFACEGGAGLSLRPRWARETDNASGFRSEYAEVHRNTKSGSGASGDTGVCDSVEDEFRLGQSALRGDPR